MKVLRLTKSDFKTFGVCDTLAKKLSVDVYFVRLFFLFVILGSGFGMILYFSLYFLLKLNR
jgi:phage shock protein PspC (stress-responsive transcriptional regulator)